MNKCIYVVPTYRKHFQHAYKLIESYEKFNLNADLLFILSDEKEYHDFENKTTKKMFLEKNFPRGVDHRGIITIKKLKGVEAALKSGYEYAVVSDCEINFTRDYNSYDAVKSLSDNKKIYCTKNIHPIIVTINKHAAEFFNSDEREQLKKITNNFEEYFWFNDLAFYDLNLCNKFFSKMYKNGEYFFYSKMSSGHFDHIIYVFYCLLYENYKLENINDENIPVNVFSKIPRGALEAIGDIEVKDAVPDNVAKSLVEKINPFWMPYGTNLRSDNCFILYHYDRQFNR